MVLEPKWVALIILDLMKRGCARKDAEELLINYFRGCKNVRSELGDFARRILSEKTDWLSATYQEAKFYRVVNV